MDRKRFNEIYRDLISQWPESINVTEKTLFDSGGANIPNLIKAHDEVSNILEDTYPEYTDKTSEYIGWCGLIDWSIYQLLHKLAKDSNCKIVYPHALDIEAVLKRCLENKDFISDWKEIP